jgi:hypothetical protein
MPAQRANIKRNERTLAAFEDTQQLMISLPVLVRFCRDWQQTTEHDASHHSVSVVQINSVTRLMLMHQSIQQMFNSVTALHDMNKSLFYFS